MADTPLPTWPDDLPQEPYYNDENTPQFSPAIPNMIRTNVDAGPNKQRRRFTSVTETVSVIILLDSRQWSSLLNFFENVLGEVKPFAWKDFRTGENATFRFTDRPSSQWFGEDVWQVTLPMELLP